LKLTRRTFTLKNFTLLFLVFYAVACSGCGGGKAPGNELVMWLVGSEGQAKTINEISEKFTERTGVAVNCQAISWGDAHSKYLTSIAGEVTPDIGTMGLTWGMEFGSLGVMVDLREEFPEEVAGLERKIFKGISDSTKIGNKVYGIPFDLSEHILFYRKDIVPEPPRDWDELVELLRELKSQGRGMIIDWGSLEWIGFSPFLWQAGGDYYNSDHTRVTLDTPEASAALGFFGRLYDEGVPKAMVPLEQGMRTGDYPLAISGNWKIISLRIGAPEIKGKWAIAMLPEGPSGKRTAFIGGRILGIFTRSEKKKEAWEFIKFLFEPENQIKIYESALESDDAYLPPNIETWRDLPMEDDFKKVLERQARDAKGPPPVLAWDSSSRFVDRAIQMVVLKKADPAEELRKANVRMQEELDRMRE